MTEISLAGAINQALADALETDDSVLVFGEDVGTLGGVFRVTDGLARRFGERRVFDSPLAEAGIVGTAIGMAMNGLRPIVEMQFDAFAYPAFEQIISHAAKLRNRTRGAVSLPMVIRIPYGGGIGGVEHHSDSSEAYYAHTPGLTVVSPSDADDGYHLLRQAIGCDDPVLFLEPKRRYWAKAEVGDRPGAAIGCDDPVLFLEPKRRYWAKAEVGDRPVAAFGDAVVRRSGSDVTLLAYGGTVATALAAAEVGAEDGLSLEVVDLRSLSPFDDATAARSVRKTGRAVVVHEAARFGGYGAEVAARLSEQCFHQLQAPILRVTGWDVPYPPPRLEEHHLPNVDRILDAVGRLQWDDRAVQEVAY